MLLLVSALPGVIMARSELMAGLRPSPSMDRRVPPCPKLRRDAGDDGGEASSSATCRSPGGLGSMLKAGSGATQPTWKWSRHLQAVQPVRCDDEEPLRATGGISRTVQSVVSTKGEGHEFFAKCRTLTHSGGRIEAVAAR